MSPRAHAQTKSAEDIVRTRNRLVLDQARAAGLLGTAKNTRLAGRVSTNLVQAAKERSHVTSDTELLELALSRLALEDGFGAKLLRRKGSVAAVIDLEL